MTLRSWRLDPVLAVSLVPFGAAAVVSGASAERYVSHFRVEPVGAAEGSALRGLDDAVIERSRLCSLNEESLLGDATLEDPSDRSGIVPVAGTMSPLDFEGSTAGVTIVVCLMVGAGNGLETPAVGVGPGGCRVTCGASDDGAAGRLGAPLDAWTSAEAAAGPFRAGETVRPAERAGFATSGLAALSSFFWKRPKSGNRHFFSGFCEAAFVDVALGDVVGGGDADAL